MNSLYKWSQTNFIVSTLPTMYLWNAQYNYLLSYRFHIFCFPGIKKKFHISNCNLGFHRSSISIFSHLFNLKKVAPRITPVCTILAIQPHSRMKRNVSFTRCNQEIIENQNKNRRNWNKMHYCWVCTNTFP